jgi:PST family polysaccharide transporter
VCSAPRLPLSLAARETRELLGFGSGMSLNSVINYLAANVDYATISRYIGASALGLYGQAYRLISLPVSKIAGTLSSAMFPSFSEIRGDKARLRRAYLRGVGATSLVTFPVLIGSLAAAETVITGFFGEQWRSASLAFRILAVAGMLKAIFHLAGPLAQASGRITSEIWRQGVYLAVLTAGCLVGLRFGIEGVSCAVVIGSFWMYVAMANLALDIVDGEWQDFFLAQRPGLIVGALTGIVALALELANHELMHLPTPLMLFAVVVCCATCATLCVLYLPAALIGDLPVWLLDHSRDRLPRGLGAWLGRRLGVD